VSSIKTISPELAEVSTANGENVLDPISILHATAACCENSMEARNCARHKNNTKALFVMMLIDISSLKIHTFCNEFKNDWNY
jgi:hypothetical protein